MLLTGLHLLLTYQCTFECNHCFVWGGPFQSGTMTLQDIQRILKQGRMLGTVTSIYFEGGEPFLYYPVMVKGVHLATAMGFKVGLVTNSYWANSLEDALAWLKPLAGLVSDLSLSSDLYHYDERISQHVENARAAARQLGLPVDLICIAQPEADIAAEVEGQLPNGELSVMYRGRAAVKLVDRAALHPWRRFDACPYEDLNEPKRVHIDPSGYIHICQGISLGNLIEKPLNEICQNYDPRLHPITGPLYVGGPAQLVEDYSLPHRELYADACHLCYEARLALRPRFPEILTPDQMYGVI